MGFTMEFRNEKITVVLITVRNSSCGKVMFSQASVSHSVHWDVRRSGCAWWGGHAWQGACVAGGHIWWWGAFMVGAMCGGQYAWQGVIWDRGHAGWGHVWWGGGAACVVGETVTAADGTHPTEMHSCFLNVLPVIPISVSYFVDNSLDVSGLLEEMMQKMNQLNESLSQEKERVTKLEGL